jgi:Spy/CpxP family protein refolding chaperone
MKRLVAAVIVLLISPAIAQEHPRQHGQTPYAELQQRTIKALGDQQIVDLRAGRGMGLALVAELNGYPGPLHVLELADQLGLTAEQRQRVEALHAAMKAEAISVGERLIAQEAALDRQFADRKITLQHLVALAAQIGETQATLRATHLKYHLITAELLMPEQTRRYGELRGYH